MTSTTTTTTTPPTATLDRSLKGRSTSRFMVGIVLGILLMLAFVLLGLAEDAGHLKFDMPFAAFIQDRGYGPGRLLFRLLNLLGSLPVWDSLVLLFAAGAYFAGRKRESIFLIAGLSVEIATLSVKTIVYGPQPPGTELGALLELTAAEGFPSGHVARTMVILGLLIALFVWRRPRLRLPAVLLAIAFLLPMGLARVVSGSHRPTEVFGGYLLAGLWLDLLLLAWMYFVPPRVAGPFPRRPD